ncbi:MAG TPA: winged helix-turn-helix domain-containing protein [Terracidiphilus sp.]|nr:winged helix-turn-helix domain-containing protein [Terracidiphilus sp.]
MKGQVAQVTRAISQSKEESPFMQSKYPPSTVTLQKIHRSAKFIPVLVFIPARVDGDQVSLHRLLGEESLAHIDDGWLTEVLEKGDGTPQGQIDEDTIAFGDVTVDFLRMEAFRKKEPVVLTTLQFKTLRYLIRHARRVISRDELLDKVWGYEHYPTTRSVDNVIVKLRQKLESNPSRPAHFCTIYGTGYKFLP